MPRNVPFWSPEIGQKFNSLTAVRPGGRVRKFPSFWFLCDCGKEVEYPSISVKRGALKSCGCLKRRRAEELYLCRVYKKYEKSAVERGIDFSLTLKEFSYLATLDCCYCGAPPKVYTGEFGARNGVDRFVNSAGYNSNNCVPCCADCNFFKGNRDGATFLRRIKRIYLNITEV